QVAQPSSVAAAAPVRSVQSAGRLDRRGRDHLRSPDRRSGSAVVRIRHDLARFLRVLVGRPTTRPPVAQPKVGIVTNDRIPPLGKAVEANPEDVLLRLVLAESLVNAGTTEEALDQYVVLLDQHGLPDDQFVPVGELAAANGRLAL